jgi:hypothetical protein
MLKKSEKRKKMQANQRGKSQGLSAEGGLVRLCWISGLYFLIPLLLPKR